jgi:hypothetical protein
VTVWLGPTPGDDREYGDTEPAPLRTTPVAAEATPARERVTHARAEDGAPHEALGRAFIAARCAREARCGNVGEDHDYADTASCLVGTVDVWSAAYDCPSGIAPAQLSACLDAIRSADCRTEMLSLDRLAACRTGRVCRD